MTSKELKPSEDFRDYIHLVAVLSDENRLLSIEVATLKKQLETARDWERRYGELVETVCDKTDQAKEKK